MPERRTEKRPDAPDRRSFPRPPLWLNLLLIALGLAGLAFGRYHRVRVSDRYSSVLTEQQRTPSDTRKIKEELAEMDLTRAALETELNGRMKFLQSLKSENFYLSIDTQAKKLRFYYGDTVLREADVALGANTTLKSPDGRSWTFVPVKGAFPVEAKLVDYNWRVPEWLYVMNQKPIPESRPVIEGGLGRYVIVLPNNYVIHSPPVERSPLQGPKPGSFMVAEEDLRAIWERIHTKQTPIYIF
jgi:hypothetical protein